MFGAVDVGGTKTLVAIFDHSGQPLEEHRFKTPKIYSEFTSQLAKIVDKLSTKNLLFTAVALPARIDRSRGVGLFFGNLPWQNVPVRDDLEKIFHCPVVIENDANLAGLYEAVQLKDVYKKVLYLTISTGIGAGFCVDGSIDKDNQDKEIGSMIFEHEGKVQKWESFASGKAIKEKFGKNAEDITDPESWTIIAKNIAIGTMDLIATLTPDVVVFGGGVGAHFEKFEAQLVAELEKYKTNMVSIPPLMKAKKAEEAVLYGCFCLAKEKYETASN